MSRRGRTILQTRAVLRSASVFILGSALLGDVPCMLAQPGNDGVSHLRAALEQTLNHEDLEASIALYEPDAVFLSPAGRFPDRAAIRTLYRSLFLGYRGQIEMTSKRQVASGDVCVEDGSYSETLTEVASGKRTAITGDYVLVARRQPDSSWKVAELVWTQTSAKPA